MKLQYLYLLIALITMSANIVLTVFIIKLGKRVHSRSFYKENEAVVFQLPGKVSQDRETAVLTLEEEAPTDTLLIQHSDS